MIESKKVFLWTLGIIQVVYVAISGVYFHFLSKLNGELTGKLNALEIVQYNHYQPIWFVFYALALATLAILITIGSWKIGFSLADLWDNIFILPIIVTLINISCLIINWNLISVPILKTVFSFFVVGIAFVYSFSSN